MLVRFDSLHTILHQVRILTGSTNSDCWMFNFEGEISESFDDISMDADAIYVIAR